MNIFCFVSDTKMEAKFMSKVHFILFHFTYSSFIHIPLKTCKTIPFLYLLIIVQNLFVNRTIFMQIHLNQRKIVSTQLVTNSGREGGLHLNGKIWIKTVKRRGAGKLASLFNTVLNNELFTGSNGCEKRESKRLNNVDVNTSGSFLIPHLSASFCACFK